MVEVESFAHESNDDHVSAATIAEVIQQAESPTAAQLAPKATTMVVSQCRRQQACCSSSMA